MRAVFRTRLTELFGVTHPVFGGGLMWLSDARYVAGIVNAGGMAFMTPRSFETLEGFGDQLKRCAEFTQGKPFGVNLTLSKRIANNDDLPRQLDLALAHGVRHFETVGPSPGPLIETIRAAGGVVMHKAAFIAHALKAEALGAHALALVGMEAGGHPGLNELPASLLCALALEQVKVPLALGGGVGHGRQIAAALALGCDGVVMGTRFLACDEVWAHANYKQCLVDSPPEASTVAMRAARDPWRVLANQNAREVQRLEAAGIHKHADFGALVLGRTGRDGAYRDGDVERGMLSMGPAVGFTTACEPIQDVMERLMADAAAHMRRAGGLVIEP